MLLFRLNDAPVRGYEDDVGNKTTMRFFYPESAYYNPKVQNDPDTLLVLVPFKMQDLRWLKEILYNEKRVLNTRTYTPHTNTFCLFAFPAPSTFHVTNKSLKRSFLELDVVSTADILHSMAPGISGLLLLIVARSFLANLRMDLIDLMDLMASRNKRGKSSITPQFA